MRRWFVGSLHRSVISFEISALFFQFVLITNFVDWESTLWCWLPEYYDFTAEYSPFLGIEKGAVLQEARVFNDPQLDARRCSQVVLSFFYLSMHFLQFFFSSNWLGWALFLLLLHLQVITKLLYLLNQGETFTKVRLPCHLFTCTYMDNMNVC